LALSGSDHNRVNLRVDPRTQLWQGSIKKKKKKKKKSEFSDSVKNPSRTARLLALFNVFITTLTDSSQNYNPHHASPQVWTHDGHTINLYSLEKNQSSDVKSSNTTARPGPDLVLHDPTLVQTPEVLATGQRPSLSSVFQPKQYARLRGPDYPIGSPTKPYKLWVVLTTRSTRTRLQITSSSIMFIRSCLCYSVHNQVVLGS